MTYQVFIMLTFEYENEFRKAGKTVCGVDEAGRGPLCGPVYAAAVILPEGYLPEGLDDSKKLSGKKREELYSLITANAEAYCVAYATVEEIDRLNIMNAAFLAMRRAIDGLAVKPELALIDGNRINGLDVPARCIIKGDAKCPSISAASILAKVERDRCMERLDALYPQYNLKKHKGYPTKEHYELLYRYGVNDDIYRKSFLKNLGSHIPAAAV